MSNFESVVRPFETDTVTPPERVPESQIVPVKNTIINPGQQGAAKTMSGHFEITETFYLIKRPVEKKQTGDSYDPYSPANVQN